MLHILFLILKIIGIILLTIFGILILSFSLVFFAPAYYQVRAKTDGGWNQLDVSVKAHWFFHLASAIVRYSEGKFNWQFRIAWKKFHDSDKKTNHTVEDRDDSENDSNAEEHAKHATDTSADDTEPKPNVKNKKDTKVTAKKKQNWFEKIKCTIRKICDKIKELWKSKEKITDFLTDETHKSAFQRVKQDILILAKRLSPRTLRGYVRFGFDDPYNTGRVLAGLSVLYPFYGDKVDIYPEFEKKVLEGDIYMKGHIRGIHLLIIVLKLILDKDIRKTYQDFKTWKQ